MRVAAVQCALQFHRDEAEFAQHILRWAREAKSAGADLAVFPEDVGLSLVCLGDYDLAIRARTVTGLVLRLTLRHWRALLRGLATPSLGPRRAIILNKAQRALAAYTAALSAAARDCGLFLVGGSIPSPAHGDPHQRVYNVSHVYAPDGSLLGISRKVNLIDMEYRELDLSAAPLQELPVYDLPGGRMGVAICRDTWEPPVTKWLQDKGAQLICSPQANPFPWASEKPINRQALFARCQEQSLFGVQAMAVGGLAEVKFQGQSAIFAPTAMTPDGSGVIAEALSYAEEELVVADLPITG